MDESQRLSALQRLDLLDTEPSESLDRLTRLAAQMFDAKVALVTLVDEERQWFKSVFGTEVKETGRDLSFCAHAIESDDVMVVPDLAADKRFVDNAFVTGEPFVRFYAGAPLRTKDGAGLGTLCVLDDKPRNDFAGRERQMLADLAVSVMTEIENSHKSVAIDELTLVTQELKHRMGNMYAQMSSLISLVSASVEDKEELVRILRDKINSLSNAQTMLLAAPDQNISLSELADGIIRPLLADEAVSQIHIKGGADLLVNSRAAFTLSLLLNELSMNALKHGALKSADGHVELDWRRQGDDVEVMWRETSRLSHPPKPRSGGFGMMLLEKLAPAQMRGVAGFSADANGLTYRLKAAVDQFAPILKEAAENGASALTGLTRSGGGALIDQAGGEAASIARR